MRLRICRSVEQNYDCRTYSTACSTLRHMRNRTVEVLMPYDEVMHKFKGGKLHSGSAKGPKVTNRKQAVAIMLSEKREASKGKEEYKPRKK